MARGQDIVSVIKRQIEEFGSSVSLVEVGTVVEVGDGIARIQGLSAARNAELLEFPNEVFGVALNLEEEIVGAAILGEDTKIKEGDEVRTTGRILEVPVGTELLGRVVDALGKPIDGKGPLNTTKRRPVERVAPDVTTRQSVNTPVQTGIKSIDAMVPVGRGQRELIIGDRSTGKTAIAIDAIINQKGKDLICIYVAIGQKQSKIRQISATLEQQGAMAHTIIVAAASSDPAPLQWLAPFAGCAMGEEFMDNGKEVLIVYDDLSKHAWAYRQMSLLLRRPPGREAYPGDVFYLHSRLLERAARLDKAHGGGSMTALPIIETLANDVSAYIPTNVISITDGQIYLETDLFNAGIRPAVNAGLSVSRVGSSAQTKAMKKVAGRLRIDLAQYASLAAFAQFGTADLDASTRKQLERGALATELLKQEQYQPRDLDKQVTVFYALANGFMDAVPALQARRWEKEFLEYMATRAPEIGKSINETRDVIPATEEALKKAIAEFNKGFKA